MYIFINSMWLNSWFVCRCAEMPTSQLLKWNDPSNHLLGLTYRRRHCRDLDIDSKLTMAFPNANDESSLRNAQCVHVWNFVYKQTPRLHLHFFFSQNFCILHSLLIRFTYSQGLKVEKNSKKEVEKKFKKEVEKKYSFGN